jgi:hypothetical protein
VRLFKNVAAAALKLRPRGLSGQLFVLTARFVIPISNQLLMSIWSTVTNGTADNRL